MDAKPAACKSPILAQQLHEAAELCRSVCFVLGRMRDETRRGAPSPHPLAQLEADIETCERTSERFDAYTTSDFNGVYTRMHAQDIVQVSGEAVRAIAAYFDAQPCRNLLLVARVLAEVLE